MLSRSSNKVLYSLSNVIKGKKYQHQQQTAEPRTKEKEIEKSLDQFSKVFNITKTQPINKPQQKNEESIIIKTQTHHSKTQIKQFSIEAQAQALKMKILQGQLRPSQSEQQHFARIGRPEQVYLKNQQERRDLRMEKDLTELNELQKGEEGIDYVSTPMSWVREQNASWDYGMTRLDEAFAAQEEGATSLISADGKMADVAEWRQWNEAFEPIHRQQSEAFPVVPYLGSEKGENPYDDPEHYVQWFQKTFPPEVVDGVKRLSSLIRGETEQDEQDEEEDTSIIEQQTEIYTSANEAIQPCLNMDLVIEDIGREGYIIILQYQYDIRIMFIEDKLGEMDGTLVLRSKLEAGEIEPLPEHLPLEPTEMLDEIERWTRFRSTQIAVKLQQKLEYFISLETEQVQQLPTLTSLYPYYCTLPRQIRDHPQVKTAYKALEFTKPTLSIQEKEKALNFICTSALELDELSQRIFGQLAETRRFHPTIEDENRLIHENETDVIDSYMNPALNEQYQASKGMYPNLNPPEGDYPYPYPKRMLQEDEDTTPVDFYDNDDGFWDQYITNKLDRYSSVHRPSTSRKYFKH